MRSLPQVTTPQVGEWVGVERRKNEQTKEGHGRRRMEATGRDYQTPAATTPTRSHQSIPLNASCGQRQIAPAYTQKSLSYHCDPAKHKAHRERRCEHAVVWKSANRHGGCPTRSNEPLPHRPAHVLARVQAKCWVEVLGRFPFTHRGMEEIGADRRAMWRLDRRGKGPTLPDAGSRGPRP